FHASPLRCFLQFGVERGERNAVADREFQIRGIVRRTLASLIREAPSERHRRIHNHAAQNRRPSFTISRTLIVSGFTRLRSARMPSTISSCVSLGPASPTGTNIAAG